MTGFLCHQIVEQISNQLLDLDSIQLSVDIGSSTQDVKHSDITGGRNHNGRETVVEGSPHLFSVSESSFSSSFPSTFYCHYIFIICHVRYMSPSYIDCRITFFFKVSSCSRCTTSVCPCTPELHCVSPLPPSGGGGSARRQSTQRGSTRMSLPASPKP